MFRQQAIFLQKQFYKRYVFSLKNVQHARSMTPELLQVVLWLSILRSFDDLGSHTWTSHVKALLFTGLGSQCATNDPFSNTINFDIFSRIKNLTFPNVLKAYCGCYGNVTNIV